jgi:acetyl esterase/lipase
MPRGPEELAFVLEVPAEGVAVERLSRFDLYRPAGAAGPLPTVVFVHGPVPPGSARPRDWPVYQGYGRLVDRWLACVALSYPLLDATPAAASGEARATRPDRPVVLTRVGRERPEVQARVDAFLDAAAAAGAPVEVVDVPDGQHGFDALDHQPRSREAVIEALEAVQRHLLSSVHSRSAPPAGP